VTIYIQSYKIFYLAVGESEIFREREALRLRELDFFFSFFSLCVS
jgi:hypothetical protein